MDMEQEETQFLGIFGIYKESYKLISSCAKIFSEITLALILPLSFIFLAHIEVTHLFLNNIVSDGRGGAMKVTVYNTNFWVFKALYFTFLLIFSLLSTSAVVYTVACVYTSRDVSFKKVMSVVPKVWKRLMVTSLCLFVALFVYNLVAILVVSVAVGILIFVLNASMQLLYSIFIVLAIIYSVGIVYISTIWQLASVVSVLEDIYGFRAMMKSKELIKGKMIVVAVVFVMLNISFWIIQTMFDSLVVNGGGSSVVGKTGFAVLCLLLLSMVILFGLVMQTVVYFVCKSYHHESIDKSMLSDHLEVYLGEYVPLKAKDVQLEHFDV